MASVHTTLMWKCLFDELMDYLCHVGNMCNTVGQRKSQQIHHSKTKSQLVICFPVELI